MKQGYGLCVSAELNLGAARRRGEGWGVDEFECREEGRNQDGRGEDRTLGAKMRGDERSRRAGTRTSAGMNSRYANKGSKGGEVAVENYIE